MFGTKMTDEFFGVHTGGDVAFLNGVMKDPARHRRHRQGVRHATTPPGSTGCSTSSRRNRSTGSKPPPARPAPTWRGSREMYADANSAVLVWSMGITQHVTGVDNVKAIVNLALARGNVGRAGRGPDADPWALGCAGRRGDGLLRDRVSGRRSRSTRRMRPTWRRSGGSRCRRRRGLDAAEMVEGARRGDIEVLWSSGGNFLDVLPAPDITRTALARTPLRVHQDIVLTHQMLVDPGETVVLLPGRDALRTRGWRHVDHHRAARRVQPRARRAHASARRAASTRSSSTSRAGSTPTAPIAFGCETRRRRFARRSRASCPRTRASRRCARPATRSRWAASGLCEGGVFPTADGRAHFSVVVPDHDRRAARPLPALDPAGQAVQLHGVEGRRPAHRRARATRCSLSESDAAALGVGAGDAVLVRSPHGEMRARAHLAPMRRGNVQAFFPEANVLLAPNRRDPISGVPDYNAVVEVVKFA